MLPDIIEQAIKYRDSVLPEICGHTFYRPPIGPGSIVVDLGAHLGSFSQAMIGLYSSTHHAVEAVPQNCEAIPKLAGLHVHNYAITDHEGPIRLNIAERPTPWGSIQSLGQTDYKDFVETTGIRLGTFLTQNDIKAVDLLKIDIEGEEFSLFNTTDDETLKSISQITIEFHNFLNPEKTPAVERIIARLEHLGFAAFVMTKNFHGDVLFINREKIPVSACEIIYFRSVVKSIRGIRRILRNITR
ncbi:MAG: FkbM family methyltransferase [Rhodospirillales bacterium]